MPVLIFAFTGVLLTFSGQVSIVSADFSGTCSAILIAPARLIILCAGAIILVFTVNFLGYSIFKLIALTSILTALTFWGGINGVDFGDLPDHANLPSSECLQLGFALTLALFTGLGIVFKLSQVLFKKQPLFK